MRKIGKIIEAFFVFLHKLNHKIAVAKLKNSIKDEVLLQEMIAAEEQRSALHTAKYLADSAVTDAKYTIGSAETLQEFAVSGLEDLKEYLVKTKYSGAAEADLASLLDANLSIQAKKAKIAAAEAKVDAEKAKLPALEAAAKVAKEKYEAFLEKINNGVVL